MIRATALVLFGLAFAQPVLAQAVIAPVLRATWREVEALSETRRGAGGFGSTGI